MLVRVNRPLISPELGRPHSVTVVTQMTDLNLLAILLDLMQTRKIRGKRVYVFESHNEAFAAWTEVHRL